TAPETSNDDAEEQNQGPTQNPPPNNTNQTSNPPPPPSSNNFPPPPRQQPTTTRDLTFLIDHVIPGYNGNPHYIILSAPLVVEGFDISFLTIQSNDPLLQGGNQVIIRDVELGSGRAEVDAHIEEISIKNYFRTIELVSTTPPPGGGSRTPNNPPPLPSFPDVVKKNQDLIDEENSFFKLRDELKDIINKNKSVVQEAQTLGLTLPSFSDNALDFFQTAPFVLFDAGQPLNSPFNQQISDKNDKIRQKALNLKNNIYQIYNNNVKKLNEKKQGEQGGSPPPENELTKLKKQAINKISNILTDPDNLRNIDLNTLAGVNDYLNAFSTALKEKGVEEKEIKEQEKNDNSSDHDSQKNDNVIDDKTKNFIKILPLPSAKNVAKNKILELFRKHRPDLEKLKEN
ncbi:29664_t:CDS:2, partial [Racocetra persica]